MEPGTFFAEAGEITMNSSTTNLIIIAGIAVAVLFFLPGIVNALSGGKKDSQGNTLASSLGFGLGQGAAQAGAGAVGGLLSGIGQAASSASTAIQGTFIQGAKDLGYDAAQVGSTVGHWVGGIYNNEIVPLGSINALSGPQGVMTRVLNWWNNVPGTAPINPNIQLNSQPASYPDYANGVPGIAYNFGSGWNGPRPGTPLVLG
jgi:hypothetical protein